MFQQKFPFAKPSLLDRFQPFQRSEYEGYFSSADAAFRNWQVASTQKGRKTYWKIGVPLSDLWEWSLGYRMPHTSSELCASQALQLAYDWAAMVEENKLQFATSLCRYQPLARKSLWTIKAIPPRFKAKNLTTKIFTDDGRVEEGGSAH